MFTAILITVVCLGQLPQAPAAGDAAAESIEVRYARDQVQLAEANLSRVEQSNKKVAGAVPGSIVAEYHRDLQVAKIRLDQATAGRQAGEFRAPG